MNTIKLNKHADFAEFAFEYIPIALCVLQERRVSACNPMFTQLFGGTQADFMGKTIEKLFPSQMDFELIGEHLYSALERKQVYSDERLMRNLQGEIFWCRVHGKTLNQEQPKFASVWVWEKIERASTPAQNLSHREKEVLAYLAQGLTNKEMARLMGISFRTVEMHRARLLKKVGASSTLNLLRAFH